MSQKSGEQLKKVDDDQSSGDGDEWKSSEMDDMEMLEMVSSMGLEEDDEDGNWNFKRQRSQQVVENSDSESVKSVEMEEKDDLDTSIMMESSCSETETSVVAESSPEPETSVVAESSPEPEASVTEEFSVTTQGTSTMGESSGATHGPSTTEESSGSFTGSLPKGGFSLAIPNSSSVGESSQSVLVPPKFYTNPEVVTPAPPTRKLKRKASGKGRKGQAGKRFILSQAEELGRGKGKYMRDDSDLYQEDDWEQEDIDQISPDTPKGNSPKSRSSRAEIRKREDEQFAAEAERTAQRYNDRYGTGTSDYASGSDGNAPGGSQGLYRRFIPCAQYPFDDDDDDFKIPPHQRLVVDDEGNVVDDQVPGPSNQNAASAAVGKIEPRLIESSVGIINRHGSQVILSPPEENEEVAQVQPKQKEKMDKKKARGKESGKEHIDGESKNEESGKKKSSEKKPKKEKADEKDKKKKTEMKTKKRDEAADKASKSVKSEKTPKKSSSKESISNKKPKSKDNKDSLKATTTTTSGQFQPTPTTSARASSSAGTSTLTSSSSSTIASAQSSNSAQTEKVTIKKILSLSRGRKSTQPKRKLSESSSDEDVVRKKPKKD